MSRIFSWTYFKCKESLYNFLRIKNSRYIPVNNLSENCTVYVFLNFENSKSTCFIKAFSKNDLYSVRPKLFPFLKMHYAVLPETYEFVKEEEIIIVVSPELIYDGSRKIATIEETALFLEIQLNNKDSRQNKIEFARSYEELIYKEKVDLL